MLSGRLAWVTGGGRGIGQAVSQILAREGARVVVSDLNIESCQETIQVCFMTLDIMKDKFFRQILC